MEPTPLPIEDAVVDPGLLSSTLIDGPILGAPLLIGCGFAVLRGAYGWSWWRAHATDGEGVDAADPVDRSTDRWLFTLLLALGFIATSCALLAACGLLGRTGIVVTSALFALTSPKGSATRSSSTATGWSRWRSLGLALPLVLCGWLLIVDLATYLPVVPSNWDAMGYHLFFAARWLQAGALETVPTVFGDPAHPFGPHNGALIFAWQMALLGRDATTNCCQLAALAVLCLALFRLGRGIGADLGPAILVALLPLWLEPLRHWTYSANVDVFLIAFGVATLALLLAYQKTRRPRDLLAAGLAGGLAAGTKLLGLPLAGVPGLVVTLWLLGRRRWHHLALYLGSAVAAGGWWALRTALWTGNPLFPLHLELGPFTLPGAYGGEALRNSEFHIANRVDLLVWTGEHLGTVTLALALSGWVALLIVARRPRRRGPALLVAGASLAWALYFLFASPHNNQSRFVLPAVALALAGWGPILSAFGRRWGRAAGLGLWFAVVLLCAFESKPWHALAETFGVFEAVDLSPIAWLTLVVLTVALGLFWRRRRSLLTAGSLGALLVLLPMVAAFHAETGRPYVLSNADYRLWSSGYLPLLEAPVPPLRIAYSGISVPYVLMGSGWRHEVRYVNTQGEADDGFFDFWQRDQRLYPIYKPPIYRGADHEATWLAHLEYHRIDLLAVFILHPAERGMIASTPERFPIEAAWARGNPDRFVPILTTPTAEIYSLRKPSE